MDRPPKYSAGDILHNIKSREDVYFLVLKCENLQYSLMKLYDGEIIKVFYLNIDCVSDRIIKVG
jgi:hypothetical protein